MSSGDGCLFRLGGWEGQGPTVMVPACGTKECTCIRTEIPFGGKGSNDSTLNGWQVTWEKSTKHTRNLPQVARSRQVTVSPQYSTLVYCTFCSQFRVTSSSNAGRAGRTNPGRGSCYLLVRQSVRMRRIVCLALLVKVRRARVQRDPLLVK